MPESPRVQVRPSTAFGGSWFWWCDVCSGGGWKSSCAAAGDAGRQHLATHHQPDEPAEFAHRSRHDGYSRAPLIAGQPCTPTGP